MKEIEERRVWRWRGDIAEPVGDEVVCEEPLEIRIDNRAISVTMRTPGDDEDLAVGFLISEGVVTRIEDIESIQPLTERPDCNVIDVRLRPPATVDFERLTRHVFGSSSCGVCGKTSIEAVLQQFPAIETEMTVEAGILRRIPEVLMQSQATFARTGGLHAAAIFDVGAELLVLREDVGRHNAVDKVVGHGARSGRGPFDRHILLVSGRASFEIMQKALAARIPIVAAISAPSTLAVEFAEENGQTLIGFLRGETMNVYANARRVRAGT